ncbi:hypothetical protein [Rummeliibacillus stabekisii]|uniref:hypothetical protein n=1 Tax=Rummeliibacillus stabekisii TaxID=241244 RepID=UPI0011709530|nr:hypothetical protein [Rummeliibacillus stabekisii]MBB5171594.1 hypothetical protein [Rummeliibacillus stabekisii]GEL05562.1 hypothetical protein RST01_21890 [Rummeliibacillus stabekisii]
MEAIALSKQSQYKAEITMKYDVSIYKKNGNEFERVPKEYLKRGNSYQVKAITDDYIQLVNGHYIVNVDPSQYDIQFGEVTMNERIPICSRSGVILRYVEKGQSFKIRSIHDNYIGIGSKQYVSSQHDITINYL